MKTNVQNGQIGLNGQNVHHHVMVGLNPESENVPWQDTVILNPLHVEALVKEIKQWHVMKLLVQVGLPGLDGQSVQPLVVVEVSIEPENV